MTDNTLFKRSIKMAKIKEEIGTIYEDFQILEKDEEKTKEKKRAYYNIKCIHCGLIKSISGTRLRQKAGTKCPNCKKIKMQSEEIGKKYGLLTVIDFDHIASDRRYVWKCKCECGNIITSTVTSLHNGTTTMCQECAKKNTHQPNLINEVGKKYGMLTVLEKGVSKNKSNAYWKCRCDCGNILTIKGTKLRSGQIGCGCIKSKGEFKINNILSQNNINYKTQVIVDNCKDITDLRFDFGIYDDKNILLYLIEYDGEQHFSPTGGWSNQIEFKNAQRRDSIKNNWCKKNNIPLIRIPYTKYDTLELKDLLLENNQYIL